MTHYYVVILMQDGRPVPFGLFDDKPSARAWAEAELHVNEDEHYVIGVVDKS